MGQAYFYNLTPYTLSLDVNNYHLADVIKPLPSSSPYTPNQNGQTYQRYDTNLPQKGQFGSKNTVDYTLDQGAGGTVSVGIEVDFAAYPQTQDILVYCYQSAVVVMDAQVGTAILGPNGGTAKVVPNAPALGT